MVRAFAWVMRQALPTSGSETLSATANIFMGQTESPLLIRPYVARLTRSELMTVMSCGMAELGLRAMDWGIARQLPDGHGGGPSALMRRGWTEGAEMIFWVPHECE